MAGYRWDPVFRVARHGEDELGSVYWLEDQLPDTLGHRTLALRHVEQVGMREDINHVLRPVVFGYRVEVDIDVLVTNMADADFLAAIENALMAPEDWDVFLSLDGGCVERQVVLKKGSSPVPISGKTVVGATFLLSLQSKTLIAAKPAAMMTDPGVGAEQLQNGNMEQWGGGLPQGFTTVVTGGSVTQESSIVHTAGGSSMKLAVTGAGSVWAQQDGIGPLSKGAWYRMSGWFNSSSSGNGRIQLTNVRTGQALNPDGRIWSGSTQYAIDLAVATVYTYGELYFRLDAAAQPSDLLRWYDLGFSNPSTLYHDDLSLYGPVLRPGVATW